MRPAATLCVPRRRQPSYSYGLHGEESGVTQKHHPGIGVEQRGRVLLARLHGGPRGEPGAAIATALAGLVTRAETDEGVGSVVLTGTHPERFLAHADVRWLQEGGAASPSVGPRAG